MTGRLATLALATFAVITLAWLWLETPSAIERGQELGRERAERLALPHGGAGPLSLVLPDPVGAAPVAVTSDVAAAPHPLALRDAALTSRRELHASVTLLDTDGAPLTDGFFEALDGDELLLTRATADASGRANLRVELPDAFHSERHFVAFRFGAPGFATTQGSLLTIAGGGHYELGVVELPRAHRLSGRVVGPSGLPVAHIEVRLELRSTPKPAPAELQLYRSAGRRTFTDAEGRFEFATLHSLHSARVGVVDALGKRVKLTRALDAPSALEHDLGDVTWTLPRERRELFRVRLVDTDGAPIPGARAGVHLIDELTQKLSEGEGWLASANLGEPADDDGWVQLREPEITRMGQVLGIAMAAPGHTARMLRHSQVRDAEVTLERSPPLRLELRDAESGAPFTHAAVTLQRARGLAAASTEWFELEAGDAPGSWLVRDAVPRDLRLVVSQEGFGRRRVRLGADLERDTTHVIELGGPRVLTFHLTDPEGAPLTAERAQLQGPRSDDARVLRTLQAEALPDGSFVARGLEPGEYALKLWSDVAPTTELSVTIGEEPVTELGALELITYGRVLLEAFDAGGEPSPHTPLGLREVDGDTTLARVKRHDDGRLLYDNLLPGLWTFTLEPGGRVEVDVRSSATHEVTLNLNRFARLEGRVLSDGEPVVGARVFALKEPPDDDTLHSVEELAWQHQMHWNIPGEHVETRSDERGEFALELPAHTGTLVLAVDDRANRSALLRVDTVAGELRLADLSIPRGEAVLEGLARDPESGEPATGGVVVVDGVEVGAIGPDGRFHITGLPERGVVVRAFLEESSRFAFADEQRVELSASAPTQVELTAQPDFSGFFCSF